MTTDEILKAIVSICAGFQAEEVILFGSRAKGTATERSDFDIAVSGVSNFYALKEAIDAIPTLYSFDVVNMDTCKNTLLLEDIRTYGRKIL
mgnify:FL=1